MRSKMCSQKSAALGLEGSHALKQNKLEPMKLVGYIRYPGRGEERRGVLVPFDSLDVRVLVCAIPVGIYKTAHRVSSLA
jgi:hypothetical protein